MDEKVKTGVSISLIAVIVVCFGLVSSFPDMKEPPTPDTEDFSESMVRAEADFESPIVKVEITSAFAYSVFSSHRTICIPDSNTIELINGEYRAGEGRVDPGLVQGLLECLTDLYECEYKEHSPPESESPLVVTITFENGKSAIIESSSSENCFTPWVIEYDGTLYYQHSRKITSAVLRLLLYLDRYKWFIESEPHYFDGKVFLYAAARLLALDIETGTVVWEVNLLREGMPPEAANLTVHEGVLYTVEIVTNDVWISKIDANSGAILWEYNYNYQGLVNFTKAPPPELYKDRLLVAFYGAVCLNTETGEKIWEIDAEHGWVIDDKFLIFGYEDTFFYGLVDINSGEIIWKMKNSHIEFYGHHDGNLYFGTGDEVVTVSTETLEETSFTVYGEEWPNSTAHLSSLYVCEAGIVVQLRRQKTESERNKIVFLDFDGSKLWEHAYTSAQHPDLSVKGVKVFQNTLYVMRTTNSKAEIERGSIDAFDIENGKMYWQKEIGGGIHTFHLYDARIYVFTDRCRAYCLDTTGEILWELTADDCAVQCLDTTGKVLWESRILDDFCATGCWSIHCWCTCESFPFLHVSDIADGFIFMGVKNRLIVLSVISDESALSALSALSGESFFSKAI